MYIWLLLNNLVFAESKVALEQLNNSRALNKNNSLRLSLMFENI